MENQQDLVRYLISKGSLISPEFIKAFSSIDRKDFVLKGSENESYEDYPLYISFGATISQPSTVVFMIEQLLPQQGEKILDVGSGSGRTSALLGQIVGKKGKVYGVELIPELVKFGTDNVNKYNINSNIQIFQAYKKELGLKEFAPYDKILVSAAARDLSIDLLDQLKEGGIMVIPIRNSIRKIKKIDKKEYEKDVFEGYSFVPLIYS